MHPYMGEISEMDDMLASMGLKDVMELFSDVPEEFLSPPLNIPKAKDEWDVYLDLAKMGARNWTATNSIMFLGRGIYNHYVPPVVGEIVRRSEFYTSYTPYQPEVSQGMLQALFEYQSLIGELVGLDVANSSMYDGATALGEAALMARRINKRRRVLVPEVMDPEKLSTLNNYVKGAGMEVIKYRFDPSLGTHDLSDLKSKVSDDVSAVYMECPNFIGQIEADIVDVKDTVGDKVLFIAGVNPISLGILKRPGDYGADIVIGEGQPLGLGMNLGGPLLGIFATSREHVRHMPGRLIGMTVDNDGRRAFTMTLQTREQHIRREKATSNICSNEALCAVASAVYLSTVGKNGLRAIAELCYERAHKLQRALVSLDGVKGSGFKSDFFNEFLWQIKGGKGLDKYWSFMLGKRIHPGYRIGREIPTLQGYLMTAVTEMNREEDLNQMIKATESFMKGGA